MTMKDPQRTAEFREERDIRHLLDGQSSPMEYRLPIRNQDVKREFGIRGLVNGGLTAAAFGELLCWRRRKLPQLRIC